MTSTKSQQLSHSKRSQTRTERKQHKSISTYLHRCYFFSSQVLVFTQPTPTALRSCSAGPVDSFRAEIATRIKPFQAVSLHWLHCRIITSPAFCALLIHPRRSVKTKARLRRGPVTNNKKGSPPHFPRRQANSFTLHIAPPYSRQNE
jgi:hypothetical protein